MLPLKLPQPPVSRTCNADLAAIDFGDRVEVWSATEGRRLLETRSTRLVAREPFSADCELIALSEFRAKGNATLVLATRKPREPFRIEAQGPIRWSPKSHKLLNSRGPGLSLWRVDEHQEDLVTGLGSIGDAEISSDEQKIFAQWSHETGNAVSVWDVSLRPNVVGSREARFALAAISPDFHHLAIGARIYNVTNESRPYTSAELIPGERALSPRGSYVRISHSKGPPTLFDFRSKAEVTTVSAPARLGAISDSERLIVQQSGSGKDRKITVLEIATGREVAAFQAELADVPLAPDPIYDPASISDNDRYLAVGTRVWDLGTKKEIGGMIPARPGEYAMAVAFSPGARYLAIAMGRCVVIDLVRRRMIHQVDNCMAYPGGLGITSDGRYLAAAGITNNAPAALWNLGTGVRIELARDYFGPVRFSPKGDLLLLSLMRFRTSDGKRLLPDLWPDMGYGAVQVFSPDGRTVESRAATGATVTWRFDSQDLVRHLCAKVNRKRLYDPEWQRYFPNEPVRETCPAGR